MSGTLQTQLLDLFLTLGSEWVLHLLIALSVISLAVALERLVHFLRHRADADRLRRDIDAKLRADDLAGARALLANQRSHVVDVARAGFDNLARGAATTEEMM